MQMFFYFIVTLFHSFKSSVILSFAFMLFTLIMELIYYETNIVARLNADIRPKFSDFLLGLFSLFPNYQFARFYGAISRNSGYHFDPVAMRWFRGTGFQMDELTKEVKGDLYPGSGNYSLIPCYQYLI